MKTFKIQITEEEMVALIRYHTSELDNQIEQGNRPPKETAERLVDLTRRLNKDTPEIEGDPRPKETLQNYNNQNSIDPKLTTWGDS